MERQVDEDVKRERAQEVRDLCDSISAGCISRRIGRPVPVLVLGREEDGQLFGRAQCQAPDVDGITFVDAGNPGDIIEVEITGTLMYEMEGEAGA
jgi:ribosomal protein S12 methylthiotransferase